MTAIPSRLITGISEIVGPDNLTRRVEDLHCYSYDGTARPGDDTRSGTRQAPS